MSNTTEETLQGCYGCGAFLFGAPVFVLVWLYAIQEWGLLFGVACGWFPAAMLGGMAGALWPLIALTALVLWIKFG